jgi:GNAT superfamily N-acetyltransferase
VGREGRRIVAVKIRKLEEDDVDGISELWQEFARLREEITEHTILNEDAADYFFGYATGLLQRKDTLTLVAEDESNKELVGYLIAQKQRKPPIYSHTRVAYLSDAYVRDSHRKQGVLRQFVSDLEAWANGEGITAIDVMLFQENQMAHEVYDHLGFHNYRTVMRKNLNGVEED